MTKMTKVFDTHLIHLRRVIRPFDPSRTFDLIHLRRVIHSFDPFKFYH